MTIRINSLNPKYIKANGEENQEIIVIEIVMIREIIKIDKDQTEEIEGQHTDAEVNMDKIIEEDHIMQIIIEKTLEETILEIHKITEVTFIKVDIEGIIEMTTLKEVEVGLGINNIQVILVDMTEVVVGGLDQVQEPVLRDRIWCFKCREYDHFAKDCPTSQVEKEP